MTPAAYYILYFSVRLMVAVATKSQLISMNRTNRPHGIMENKYLLPVRWVCSMILLDPLVHSVIYSWTCPFPSMPMRENFSFAWVSGAHKHSTTSYHRPEMKNDKWIFPLISKPNRHRLLPSRHKLPQGPLGQAQRVLQRDLYGCRGWTGEQAVTSHQIQCWSSAESLKHDWFILVV